MSKKMLIDAGHPEETRVVVLDGSRVEEFDFESRAKRQLRGNIYLARVTRVEPSLQAVFVEYGGNRHGFLAFNEIHPDYYQIPYEDRQALIEAERAQHAASDDDDDAADHEDADGEEVSASEDGASADDEASGEDDDVGAASQRRRNMRRYRVQEVIKRRQILLVQVVKEERGNKGAALTTYLSLAGRYGVLMPNTARGGGISRKITSASDRKRLKKIVEDFEVPEGMGLIVRTAGAKRTKAEIKRDYEYLMRLWETIRAQTLESIAPCLIYEESNLVKRAVRDLYDKDIDEILVDGEDAYREAKDFMRMLMPSHAKKVQPYRDAAPLYIHQRVEAQLEKIYDPVVTLKSGGYLVINQTEALVAIDVNSGRSTRERNIEATALKTNLEAAEEACRQFRLRDLAGLIVIDFIDMEESKNNRAVEKRMRDCLKDDRARVQAGKISQFGLMELSRQRRRASLIEGSHQECPTCGGRGMVRSIESAALHVLRQLEEEAFRARSAVVRVRVSTPVSLYLLNEKRAYINSLEERRGMRVLVSADDSLIPPAFELERLEAQAGDEVVAANATPAAEPAPEPSPTPDETAEASGDGEEGRSKRRRRRRRRRSSSDEPSEVAAVATVAADAVEADADAESAEAETTAESADGEEEAKPGRRRRRRGRRGGRSRRENANAAADASAEEGEATSSDEPADDDMPEGMQVVTLEETSEEIDAPLAAPEVEREAEEPKAPKPRANGRAGRTKPARPTAEATPPVSIAESDIDREDEEAEEPALVDADAAPTPSRAAPPPPDADDEARRARWQDRIRSWLGN